jgi:ribosome-associated protein
MNQNSTVKEQVLNPQSVGNSQRHAPGSDDLDDRVIAALQAASEKKAIDIVVLDLRDIASFTDYFVIVGGANERQVQAISDEVYETLKRLGSPVAHVEGYKTAEWILLDFGDFVVHVFEQKARHFYDLERLWRGSKPVELPPGIHSEADSSLRR